MPARHQHTHARQRVRGHGERSRRGERERARTCDHKHRHEDPQRTRGIDQVPGHPGSRGQHQQGDDEVGGDAVRKRGGDARLLGRCAFQQRRRIAASRVASPTCSTRTSSGEDTLILPPVTRSPTALGTGMLSPVSSASLASPRPSTTRPSTGITSPGRTQHVPATSCEVGAFAGGLPGQPAMRSANEGKALPNSSTRAPPSGARSSRGSARRAGRTRTSSPNQK